MPRGIPSVRYWRYRFHYANGSHVDHAVRAPTKFLAHLNAREFSWWYLAIRAPGYERTTISVWHRFGE